MKMTIENHNNIYELQGALVRSTVHVFKNEFETIFEEENTLTICTTGLDHIDIYGVRCIANLHNEALLKNKKLSIIGLGNKSLFNHFKALENSKITHKTTLKTIGNSFSVLGKIFNYYKTKYTLPEADTIHM